MLSIRPDRLRPQPVQRGERNRILTVLSTACEVRGIDAAGIAYHSQGKLHIYKRPRPAHAMGFQIPGNAWAVMGTPV